MAGDRNGPRAARRVRVIVGELTRSQQRQQTSSGPVVIGIWDGVSASAVEPVGLVAVDPLDTVVIDQLLSRLLVLF